MPDYYLWISCINMRTTTLYNCNQRHDEANTHSQLFAVFTMVIIVVEHNVWLLHLVLDDGKHLHVAHEPCKLDLSGVLGFSSLGWWHWILTLHPKEWVVVWCYGWSWGISITHGSQRSSWMASQRLWRCIFLIYLHIQQLWMFLW